MLISMCLNKFDLVFCVYKYFSRNRYVMWKTMTPLLDHLNHMELLFKSCVLCVCVMYAVAESFMGWGGPQPIRKN